MTHPDFKPSPCRSNAAHPACPARGRVARFLSTICGACFHTTSRRWQRLREASMGRRLCCSHTTRGQALCRYDRGWQALRPARSTPSPFATFVPGARLLAAASCISAVLVRAVGRRRLVEGRALRRVATPYRLWIGEPSGGPADARLQGRLLPRALEQPMAHSAAAISRGRAPFGFLERSGAPAPRTHASPLFAQLLPSLRATPPVALLIDWPS